MRRDSSLESNVMSKEIPKVTSIQMLQHGFASAANALAYHAGHS